MSDECLLILNFFVISPVLVMKYRIQAIANKIYSSAKATFESTA